LTVPAGSPGSHVIVRRDEGIDVEQTEEPVELVARVAALDIGKASVTACVRVPHDDKPGRRRQEVREYATLARGLLEAEGFTCWLLNAKHAQERPRPAQDRPAGRGVAGQGRPGVACAGRAWCIPSRSATCAT